ncbi:MAG: bifunctional hydroxymethylpyrimidine kinase/phosphomethylpyrimidine kinase [Verrucomicrobiota bacterium]
MRARKLKKSEASIPVGLTIAGSDNSGGAGIQADLKTMTSLGIYGCSAVTCVVAEHPGTVKNITSIPTQRVLDQVQLTFEAFPVAAMKTGMLFSRSIIECLSTWREKQRRRVPLVVDPVMVATSGGLLLKKTAIRALQEKWIPLASCVTPNLYEAEVLLGYKILSEGEAEQAARDSWQRWQVPFLIKGGHLAGRQAIDFLYDGKKMTRLSSPRVARVKTHGTGCTYSAALMSYLAAGSGLLEAARNAKVFVSKAIEMRFRLGRYTPLNHIQN